MSRASAALALLAMLLPGAAVDSGDARVTETRDIPRSVLRALGEEDERTRVTALRGLSQYGEAAIPLLLEALRDHERGVALMAQLEMERIGEPAVPHLLALLAQEGDRARSYAIAALARLGGPAMPALVQAFEHGTAPTREGVTLALSRPKEVSELALPILLAAARDQNARVRASAPRGLVRFAAEPGAVDALGQALQDQDLDVRRWASHSLSQSPVPGVRSALRDALADTDGMVRVWAAKALWAIGAESSTVVPPLLPLLEDPDPSTRHEAGRALWAIAEEGGGQEAASTLVRLLGYPDRQVRFTAERILGMLGEPATTQLLEVERDTDPESRAAQLRALGRTGSVQALPILVEATHDQSCEVRRAAIQALVMAAAPPPVLFPAALEVLGREDPIGRVSLVQAVATESRILEDPRIALLVAPDLVPALLARSGRLPDRERALIDQLGAAALPALVECLSHTEKDVRRKAAYRLAAFGPEAGQAVFSLRKAARDEDSRVRGAAVNALSKIVVEKEVLIPLMLEALEDPHWSVRSRAIPALGEKAAESAAALEGLRQALVKDPAFSVRAQAALSLKELGPAAEPALPELIRALRDEDRQVRQAAARAIGAIGPGAQDAVPHLRRAAKRKDLRHYASAALKAIGPPPDLTAREYFDLLGDRHLNSSAQAALQAMGSDAVPILIEILQERDEGKQARALSLMRQFGPQAREAIPVLAERVRRWEPKYPKARKGEIICFMVPSPVELGVLGAIGEAALPTSVELLRELYTKPWSWIDAFRPIGGPAVPPLIDVLRGADRQLQGRISSILLNMHEAALPHLLDALVERQEEDVTEGILRALNSMGRSGREEAVIALPRTEELARAKSSKVRAGALAVLVGLKRAGALPYLEDGLRDSEPVVRLAAAKGLAGLGPEVAEAHDCLLPILMDPEEEVRLAAVKALTKIGPEANALPLLRRLLCDNHDPVARSAAEALKAMGPAAAAAVPDLMWAVDTAPSRTAGAAARALGAIGPAAVPAVPLLMDHLSHLHAYHALASIGEPGLSALLEVIVGHPDRTVRARSANALASTNDPRALRALIRALSDKDDWVRHNAASALGKMGPLAAEAVPALEKATRDRKKWVRQAANSALRDIKGATVADR